MKLNIALLVGDTGRAALAAHYGEGGLATRATIEAWAKGVLVSTLETIEAEFKVEAERAVEEDRERRESA